MLRRSCVYMYGQIDGVHVKRKNHEDVRVWSSHDSIIVTERGAVVELGVVHNCEHFPNSTESTNS